MRLSLVFVLVLVLFRPALGQLALEKYHPLPAPKPRGLYLKKGDRLAICGDSITEQKMYSRIIEDYLTMCVPELGVTVRQYGWGGERAPGFLGRMTNDCLRFRPTVATTCYGMNDHEYRAYEERIGQTYRQNMAAILQGFRAAGARVVLGSPGCVGKVPSWRPNTNTVEDLNLNLCTLRNLGVELAAAQKVRFADMFWPMLTAGVAAQTRYGNGYAIAGGDGVHPGWAGHTVMAFAFLKAMGLDGDIGKLTVDLTRNRMKASRGHTVVAAGNGEFEIQSTRYPFCACLPAPEGSKASYPVCGKDDLSNDNSIRSAMALVPFNDTLNRFVLVAKNGRAARYKVTWGTETKSFKADQLDKGINLAAEFPCNPFCAAYAKVDAAVATKQAYETQQIKKDFHSAEAKTNMSAIVARTERERQPLADAIKAAFVPVTHRIKVEAQ